ncbi:MAG TPA: hypothetical protein VJT73_08045 [Polyangiaceae bacterium]|nr:hypothetical protein [Polyangiaceae bacterium]
MQPTFLPASPASTETALAPPSRPRRVAPAGVGRELLLLALLFGVTLPLFASLVLGHGPLVALGPIRAHRFRGEISGFLALALIVSQFAFSAGKRLARTRPFERWRFVHQVIAAPLLAAVVVHTGGSAGAHTNRYLLIALVAICVIAQIGHVLKAHARTASLRTRSPPAIELDHKLNGEGGWIHRAGVHLHVVLAVVVALLVALHVALVYGF